MHRVTSTFRGEAERITDNLIEVVEEIRDRHAHEEVVEEIRDRHAHELAPPRRVQSPPEPNRSQRADRAITDRPSTSVNSIESVSTRGRWAPMTGGQQQAIGDRLPTPPTPPGR
eukprot:3056043-Karenia_brevis.AAC.1